MWIATDEKYPIFEWIPGTIITDKQEDQEDFNDLLNYQKYCQTNDNGSDYVPYKYDNEENIIGSQEAKYPAMDEEEGMIATDNNTVEHKESNDQQSRSNESEL